MSHPVLDKLGLAATESGSYIGNGEWSKTTDAGVSVRALFHPIGDVGGRRLSIIIMVALALKAITIVIGFRLQADWGNPAIVGLATGLLWVYFSAVGWLMAT